MWTIFGGHGWIGSQFIELLKERNIDYEIPEIRMDDTQAVNRYLYETKPDRVISFIGRTHGPGYSTIDYLEIGRPQLIENVRDNLYAPISLAILCSRLDIHFTYLGTGCIFQYTEEDMEHIIEDNKYVAKRKMTEDDVPNFFGSGYSIVKGFTDRLFHLFQDNTLNLRIRMPITGDFNHPRNFITKILHYPKICSIPNSMTVLPDILPIVIDMIQTKKTGTYNMCNPGVISHNDILDMYIKYIDASFVYENFTKEEQEMILKADRSNNHLETSLLEQEYNILPIEQSLQLLFLQHSKE